VGKGNSFSWRGRRMADNPSLQQLFSDPRRLLEAIVRGLTHAERLLLQRFLRKIDVPDCDCDLVPACRCQRQCLRGLDLEMRPRPWCRECQGPCHCPCACCDPRTLDCGCNPEIYQVPCRHILGLKPHAIPLHVWELVLEAAWPTAYRERPPDPVRRLVVTPRGRLARIIWRHEHNLNLWRRDEVLADGSGVREHDLLAWLAMRDEHNRPLNPALASTLVLEETA
jgi:hypothetical protein